MRSILLKTSFLLPHLFIHRFRDFNYQNKKAACVSIWDDYRNYWFLLNAFWICLTSSDTDLWNIDFLDTHLDLLYTDIPSKHFDCLQEVVKTCLQEVFKTFLQDLFKTCLQDVFKMSWKTKIHYAEDVLKTSPRHVLNKCLMGPSLQPILVYNYNI